MRHAVAVVGTDTGVGKTVVTAGLVLALRARGIDATPWKPYASGGTRRAGRWVSGDVLWWRRSLGLPHPPAVLNPVCHRLPLAPAVAERLERGAGRRAHPELRAAWAAIGADRSPVLVEGVGGVLVPLEDRRLVADFLHAFDLPALVVARAGLGTINHTLLTLEALGARRVPVVGVLLNGARGGDAAERSNPGAIRRLTRVPVWGPAPWVRGVRGGVGLRRYARRLPAAMVRRIAAVVA